MERNLKCCPECQRAFPDRKKYLLKSASRRRMDPQTAFFWAFAFFAVLFLTGYYFWSK